MKKDDSSSEAQDSTDDAPEKLEDAVVFEADPDADKAHLTTPAPEIDEAVQDEGKADEDGADVDKSDEDKEVEDKEVEDKTDETAEADALPPAAPPPKRRRAWLSGLNFLLILCLAGAAGYYWWQQQQVARDYANIVDELRAAIDSKATAQNIESRVNPLKTEIDGLDRQIDQLELEQKNLQDSSLKLFELFGRDRNDWQLAEVEYLMRIAQHRLILQDDFDGAAITLQAASDRIGLTGDPGLLPVRVMISDEIAELKTRSRPDLVGMTLTLARLGRQVRALQPGFAIRVDTPADTPVEAPVDDKSGSWIDRLTAFIDSLVKVRHEAKEPSAIEASIADVSPTLEDNLKLARWAVLDRDARQYNELIGQSLRLFREFYDLDNAANNDFMLQLAALQKMQLRPEKPDITGSLRELQRILAKRENAPEKTAPTATESTDG